MLNKKSWEEFQNAGLLWFTNRMLHVFGWAIVFDYDENGKVISTYPARTKFRGFVENVEDKGFKKVSKWMKDNAEELLAEANE